ncbi:MAG: peptidyl-prolyl cis-trans isomerase [Proteobacteria bacterium]|nr:peptidyl-prolyl cis-trans isomerase [Pseudomonadota bacterium]
MLRLKKIFFTISMLSLLLPVFGCDKAPSEAPEARDEAVITVDSRTITVKEYNDALDRLLPPESEEAGPAEIAELKKSILSQLIEEALILDSAIKLGLTVTEAELEVEVEYIKGAVGDEEFNSIVTKRYGSIEGWKDELRRKLLIGKVIEQVITSRVEITEETARIYYDEHISEYRVPEQVHARMILVETETEARKVRKTLTPENFADTAKEVSISPEGERGGDLGFFGKGDMPVEFETISFTTRQGRISRILKTDYGYHIFFIEERRKPVMLEFETVKEDIIEQMAREVAERKFSEWVTTLKRNAEIRIKETLL